MRIAMSNQLFTTGYEGLDLQAFVRCLEDNGIQCVLDVRENPFSRKPGFSSCPTKPEEIVRFGRSSLCSPKWIVRLDL